MIKIRNTLSYGAADTTKQATLYENGIINTIVAVIPDWTTGTPTLTISILDADGYTLYTSSAQSENGTRLISGLAIPCDRGGAVKGVLSAGPGGTGGNAVIILYVEERR